MKDKHSTELEELEEEVIGILKRSVFDFLFEKPKSLPGILQDEKLLRQLFDYKLGQWEFDEAEILTSLVLVWDKNYPDIRPDLRNELLDVLLNLYNIGNYDLILIKLASLETEKQAAFKTLMKPVVESWYEVDTFNYFNIRSLFEIKNPLEAEKMIMDSFPYHSEDTSTEHAWYHLEIGVNLYQNNELEKAEEHFLRAYEIEKEAPSIHNYLGLISYKRSDYRKALFFFNKAAEKNKDEQEVVYIGNAGDALKNLGEYKQAIKKYEICLRVMTDDKRYRQSIAECHNSIGNKLYENLEYEKAGKAYLKAIHYDNEYAVYHSNAGLAYRYTKRYEQAKGKFEDALERTNHVPDQAKYDNYIGVLFHEQGKYEEAIEYYEKAIELDRKNLQYLRNKASAHNLLGKYEAAITAYQAATQFEKDPIEQAKDYNAIGLIYSNQFNDEMALQNYQKAFAQDAGTWVYAANIGYSYRYLDKLEEAVEFYKKAIQIDPKIAQNYYDYGNVLLQMDKKCEAKEQFEKAHELEPANYTYKTAFENTEC